MYARPCTPSFPRRLRDLKNISSFYYFYNRLQFTAERRTLKRVYSLPSTKAYNLYTTLSLFAFQN